MEVLNMRRMLASAAISVLLLASCETGVYHPSNVNPYGRPGVLYGDGRHPGVDWEVSIGTPVIAPLDGVVSSAGWDDRFHGYYVNLRHELDFHSLYSHLSQLDVQPGESVRRGQLLGLSGRDYTNRQYLHFAICRSGRGCAWFDDSYNPEKHGLGDKPQCFDPRLDYSRSSRKEITVPIACGDYARELITRVMPKGTK